MMKGTPWLLWLLGASLGLSISLGLVWIVIVLYQFFVNPYGADLHFSLFSMELGFWLIASGLFVWWNPGDDDDDDERDDDEPDDETPPWGPGPPGKTCPFPRRSLKSGRRSRRGEHPIPSPSRRRVSTR
jgi:hypothetical protein